jgi:Asparagine synthase
MQPTLNGLSPVEVIAGTPIGSVRPMIVDTPGRPIDPWSALEQALVPALAAPPLAVSFSGGRDSSLLLAVAMSAARLHGLPPPVAITMRFRDAVGSQESDWQELVIRELGVADWEVLQLGSELDYLGPIASLGLERDGLHFPPNAHSNVPVARALGRGTVVTGVGGDELLGAWRWRWRSAALRRSSDVSMSAKALGGVVLGGAPSSLRRLVFRTRIAKELHHGRNGYSWLTPAGRRAVLPGMVDAQDEPVRWGDYVHWTARRRRSLENLASLHRLGLVEGVDIRAPLFEPTVLAALAAVRGGRGWANRTEAMRDIVGDRLPNEVVTRRTKASFVDVFWGAQTRSFAESWDGTGVDDHLVDATALQAEWCSEQPDFRSTLLLQSAWLNGRRKAT